MLEHLQNYFVFREFVETGNMVIHTKDITINNWQDYYDGILNMMKDGIELDFLQKTFITVDFGDDDIVDLSIFDLFFNIIHWYLIVRSNKVIDGSHLYMNDAITQDTIKYFIDIHFVEKVRKTMDSVLMNNIIDDTIFNYMQVDSFSGYLANTINLEDDIALMNVCPEFHDLLHTKFQNQNISLEDIKRIGMERTERAIEIIINDSKRLLGYEHCFRNAFLSKEGINKKQYKEYNIHGGSKPNGQGGVHSIIIDGSYVQCALNTIGAQFVDSSAARVAQIQAKNNVGCSGNFARILGINNIDTVLHHDHEYDCHTNNYQIVDIKNEKILNMLLDRYYRIHPMGQEFIITEKDTHLIGQRIFLRSPMTCASAARGNGICYKCYGDLAYTNRIIKIGKYAAEKLSSELTQRQLSAKHILETIVRKLKWVKEFYTYLTVNINILQLSPEFEFPKDTYLVIDHDAITNENIDCKRTDYFDADDDDEEEFNMYNDSVKEFFIEDRNGNRIPIRTIEDEEKDRTSMYISPEFAFYLKKHGEQTDDNMIQVELSKIAELEDFPLFLIKIQNDELSKTLDDIQETLNKKAITTKYDRHSILQRLYELVIEGNLHIMGVHLETLLMNQIRSTEDILEKPDWDVPNQSYQMLTLNQALTDNPSITISLLYQNLSRALYYPLSFKKRKPSYMDLFFMKQPQNFLSDMSNIVDSTPVVDGMTTVVTRHRVKENK